MSFGNENEDHNRRQYDPVLMQIFSELSGLKHTLGELSRKHDDLYRQFTDEQLKTRQNSSAISYIERTAWFIVAVSLAFGERVVHWLKN